MRKIIKNAARCLNCGDVIESTFRHHFVTCSCGDLSVDGGHDYFRRAFKDRCGYEDLNETAPDLLPAYFTAPGWWAMLDRELYGMYAVDPTLGGVRVKEKYGKARVDYDSGDADLLSMYEENLDRISGQTCELCGAPGKLRSEHGYIQCQCERCHNATRNDRRQIMRDVAAEYQTAIGIAEQRLPRDADPTETEAAAIRYNIQSHRAT